MKIGCFALMEPFSNLRRQFEIIRNLGVKYVDLTDNHDGATLGTEFGFSASASLDTHPSEIRDLAADFGLTLTAVCAHANLLDPASPSRYGTFQIIKAIKLAHFLGVKQVVTTEGDPKTAFGKSLTYDESIFTIREKLHDPIRWASELGIDLLLEPHGRLTDTTNGMSDILEAIENSDCIGINLDTGNAWLGGSDPADFVRRFGKTIKHVHWKDLTAVWERQRGKICGCGMGDIPLGDGVVGIAEIFSELKRVGFDGPTTLEVAGEENLRTSIKRLQGWIGI